MISQHFTVSIRMPVQTRSMTKSIQDDTEGKWGKYWERFEVYEHLDYNGLPIDVSWRDQVALFYNPETCLWSPKMVPKAFRFGSAANIMNWVKENPYFYQEYAIYHKDSRTYDLENMFVAEHRRDLFQLTKDELVQFLIFAQMAHEAGDETSRCPQSPMEVDMEMVDQKLVRKLKRQLKKDLVKQVFSYVENYNNDPFDPMWELPRVVREYAGRSKASAVVISSYDTPIYNFSMEDERQLFITNHVGNLQKQLDIEKYEVDFTMVIDESGQTLYFIGNGSTFHASMVYLWDCDIRLVPVKVPTRKFYHEKNGEENFVFLKVDTSDYDANCELINIAGEVKTKLANWVKDGYQYKMNYRYSESAEIFHSELVELFNLGIYVEPDEIEPVSDGNMNLHVMNYYGEHCESYRFYDV